MSCPPVGAFLALWNGVADGALQPQYETWHAFEHVPERVGLPGFIWGRRYVALPGQACPAYFTLYALESLQALLTPEYQDVVEHPTPWSARMRRALSDFRREPCEVETFRHAASGTALATLCLRLAPGAPPSLVWKTLATVETLVDEGHALNAICGRVDLRSSHPLANGAPGNDDTDRVVLLEHLRDQPLQAAVERLKCALPRGVRLRSAPAHYQFQSEVRHADLSHRAGSRQPPRPDLRQRFHPGDEPS